MRWAHEHPEEMAEIARLPLAHQNEALRGAIPYDPDTRREEDEDDDDEADDAA